MAGEQLGVSVKLVDSKVQFSGTARDNNPVVMDYTPPIGQGRGYTGLEMLLLSLSGCSGTSVICLLRKMGRRVDGLEVQASGTRRTQHPTAFETIRLAFVLQSPDAQDADVQKAIQVSEETLCPVWAMLKGNVKIDTEFRVVR